MQTIKTALIGAQNDIPRLEARLLLTAVLQQPTTYLITHDDAQLTAAQSARYEAMLARAKTGEPIPYILESAPFYGRTFKVSPAVLIPRPETEQLVEEALAFCCQRPHTRLIDVGTGSGCIAITLAAELPSEQSDISAVDLSPEALAIARENSQLVANTINFMSSDLLTATDGRFDLIAANLPYITQTEFAELDYSVQTYEPTVALVGGPDGLDLVRRLLAQAQSKITPQGLILLEIGWRQGVSATAVAHTYFPTAQITCLKDFAGQDRLIKIELQ